MFRWEEILYNHRAIRKERVERTGWVGWAAQPTPAWILGQPGGQHLESDSLPCSHLLSHKVTLLGKVHMQQKGTLINPGLSGDSQFTPYLPLDMWPWGASVLPSSAPHTPRKLS